MRDQASAPNKANFGVGRQRVIAKCFIDKELRRLARGAGLVDLLSAAVLVLIGVRRPAIAS